MQHCSVVLNFIAFRSSSGAGFKKFDARAQAVLC